MCAFLCVCLWGLSKCEMENTFSTRVKSQKHTHAYTSVLFKLYLALKTAKLLKDLPKNEGNKGLPYDWSFVQQLSGQQK